MLSKELRKKAPVAFTFDGAPDVWAADEQLIYGVELEIENTANWPHWLPAWGMERTEDGSLRNHGSEFITAPMRFRHLAALLKMFFDKAKLNEENYSDRTSIHVHCNVLDMTWEQVQTLVLTYQVFERVLFKFVGGERDKNIFCVPLYDTLLSRRVLEKGDVERFKATTSTWEKYTALNFLPMYQQGSIEFRHMPGTCDLDKILLWLNILGSMFSYARTTKLEDAKTFFTTLNTNSNYINAVGTVFGGLSYALVNCEGFEEAMEAGVLSAKWSLLGQHRFIRKGKENEKFKYFKEALAAGLDPDRLERDIDRYTTEGQHLRWVDNDTWDLWRKNGDIRSTQGFTRGVKSNGELCGVIYYLRDYQLATYEPAPEYQPAPLGPLEAPRVAPPNPMLVADVVGGINWIDEMRQAHVAAQLLAEEDALRHRPAPAPRVARPRRG